MSRQMESAAAAWRPERQRRSWETDPSSRGGTEPVTSPTHHHSSCQVDVTWSIRSVGPRRRVGPRGDVSAPGAFVLKMKMKISIRVDVTQSLCHIKPWNTCFSLWLLTHFVLLLMFLLFNCFIAPQKLLFTFFIVFIVLYFSCVCPLGFIENSGPLSCFYNPS